MEVEQGWHCPVEAVSEAQFSVRGGRYRYNRFGDGSEQLFDHENDPNERENLVESGREDLTRSCRRTLVKHLQGRERDASQPGRTEG